MALCPNCDTELFSGKVCYSCGARIGVASNIPSSNPEYLIQQNLAQHQLSCVKCGFINSDTNRFCVSCGGLIQVAGQQAHPKAPAQFAQPLSSIQQPIHSGGSSSLAPRKMSFVEAIKNCFTNYANFKGRASRTEYWYFVLFSWLISTVFGVIAPGLYGLMILGLMIPGLAVWTRRMHDTGRAGSVVWFILIPLVGSIFILIWACTEGEKTQNKYGPPW